MSRAGKAWNDRRFFYWIYRVSDAAARAKWLHSLIHKALINKSVSGFFWYSDLLSRYRHLKLEGKLENQESGIPAEFRRNFAGIFQRPFFFNSKWLRWFSDECTSSEYTPKIIRWFPKLPGEPRIFEGLLFQFFFFLLSRFFWRVYELRIYTPRINRKLSEGFRSYPEITEEQSNPRLHLFFTYFSILSFVYF